MNENDIYDTAMNIGSAIVTSKAVQNQGVQLIKAIGTTATSTIGAAAGAAFSGSGAAGVGAAAGSALSAGGAAICAAAKGIVVAMGGPVGLIAVAACVGTIAIIDHRRNKK